MRNLFAIARLLFGLLGAVAVVATFIDSASAGPVQFFNFFGYFTIQGNIAVAVVLLVSAVTTLTGRQQGPALVLARAATATYIVIVGLVYNTLLIGFAAGASLPWANTVLHMIVPAYVLLDWVFFGDRTPVAWKRILVILVYPLVWTVVTLVRGATDGWVPYPFLSPDQPGGYGAVTLYCIGIALAFGLGGLGAIALSRVRILKP